MSNIAIKGAATGSGTFTLEAPATSTNRTLVLPDEAGTLATTAFVTNRLVQNLNVTTGAAASGTATIPKDDTIPQITEGTQFMSLAVTPTSATNILEISVNVQHSNSNGGNITTALFRDAVSDAIAATFVTASAANFSATDSFSRTMVAGTTSEIIFRVRIGGQSAGTTTFNGQSGSRMLGGVMASSITIKEYAA